MAGFDSQWLDLFSTVAGFESPLPHLGDTFNPITDSGPEPQALVAERPASRSRLKGWEREMHGYLKDHSGVFEPDEVRTLVAAFDSAWESVQASGAVFDSDVEAEAARAILAKHIIEAAKLGELDQRRLRDGALVSLAQSNLRHPSQHGR